ncbi:hypothetical protein PMI42_00125 [Bradyrhizobium sp. YR681]|uniref:hypothetical protein n=1 Tax=Bradyrhizobium sp. YR681 TaxID=1144344 RepID=UPI000270EE22|nr:hypothetical protein [Bradyrhizobium sp. YR681]EJN16290.1 hypothetical protein PMI42_00125 [Bradyrhizobium sp. YR681]
MTDSYESILHRRYRWPKGGDRIAQHVEKPTDAYVSQEPYERAMFIWRGYFRAGKLLAEECGRNPFDTNYLVYPMMFNYRHGLEVAMKEIIVEYGHHVSVYLSDDRDHNLLDLWQVYQELNNALNPQAGDIADKTIGLIVQDFHGLDKSAVAFRYSTNKDGAKFKLANGVVTVERLKDVMEGCEHYFEASDDFYHALVQNGPSLSDY